ncbi:MAG: SDR family NAD(P)-dependent oxidoreductase [Nitriliruptorales bacterium]|nr:SDR family NAD(P)-dependent oxidoreductase [Nitriliruptorales bacterium]
MARDSFGAGDVLVITGASSGIGRGLALAGAERGATLVLADINEVGLADTAERVRDRAGAVSTHVVDVSDRDAVIDVAATVEERHGAVRGLFNNAGVAMAGLVTEQTYEDIDWVLDINLMGVINGTQAFLPLLIASGRGHVVNVSSIFGLVGMPLHSIYCASKFAVRGYTEAISMDFEMERLPVQAHAVHPGGIKTNIAASARPAPGRSSDGFQELFNMVTTTSAERAGERIMKGTESGQRRIHVGVDARLMHLAERLSGSRYQPITSAIARRVLALTRADEDAAGP